jgi:hypothetical protein
MSLHRFRIHVRLELPEITLRLMTWKNRNNAPSTSASLSYTIRLFGFCRPSGEGATRPPCGFPPYVQARCHDARSIDA